MVSEEKAKKIIIDDVYKRLDAMGYGTKQSGAGSVFYIVRGKKMTVQILYGISSMVCLSATQERKNLV